jgi:mediator of RNA polymerase II transcription subunit 21
MAAPAEGGSGAELLTQLQDQVDAVSRKFFESVGVMQRDAPPYAAPGGPPLAAAEPSPGFDVQANARRMAAEITQQVQLTEQLLQLLPDGLGCTHSSSSSQGEGSQQQQQEPFTAEVRALQQQHQEMSQQLQQAVGEVEGELLQLQLLYSALAKAKLQAQAQAQARQG